jgi:aminoglycoside 3-N-acetyltransferase I
VRIERVQDAAEVARGAELFDHAPLPAATERFLRSPTHHLLFAYDGDEVVGMVTGVETTHPDKGTEMFLYELSVAEGARRRGIGTALVKALEALARERGCYAMWVGADHDNEAALATYRRAGAGDEASFVLFTWELGR